MRDNPPAKNENDTALETRLQSLDRKLAERRQADDASKIAANSAGRNASWGKALKMSSEFIAAVLVGAALGYFLDRFAGTAPWGLILFLLLGFVAGVVNVLRASGEMSDPFAGGWARRKKDNRQD